MTRQKTSQSGSVFTILMAGIAMAAALSVVLYSTISGPMSSMVRITNKTQAKSQMQSIASIVITDAVNNLPNNGDCTGTGVGLVVPRSWKPGTGPTGGGLLPTTIGAPLTDPWGTSYGYCVWELGGSLAAGCDTSNGYNQTCTGINGTNTCTGGTAPNINTGYNALRLLGSPTPAAGSATSQTVFAVISAGPNRTFNSTCSAYVNGSSTLVTAGGDDIVVSYTYAQASVATSSLWTLNPASASTAVINKNLAVGPTATPTFQVNSSTGLINALGLTATGAIIAGGSLQMGSVAAGGLGACASASAYGTMYYNTTTNAINVCTNTGWVPLAVSSSVLLNNIAAATGANTIDSLTNGGQVWNWSTLTVGTTALTLSAGNAAGAADTTLAVTNNTTGAGKAVSTTISGASNSGYAVYGANTGTTNTGTAGYFTNTGGGYALITGSGNVGIGTTTPTSLLHTSESAAKVASYTGVLHSVLNTSITPSINKIGMDIESTGAWSAAGDVNTGLVVNATGGTTNYAAVFTGGGNVGIGTATPFRTLDVSGIIRISSSGLHGYPLELTNGTFFHNIGPDAAIFGGASNDLSIVTGSANAIRFYINSAEKMRIDTTGNVGIGTTGPTAALHISPVAAATGTLTAERITGAANTNQTLSTEIPDIDWALARTVQWATGALTTQRAVKIAAPTYGFVGASTLTDAASLGITGAPVGGTNATVTNAHGLLISAGATANATNSYGLSVNAPTGATNNYAAQFIGGNVGIGTAAPSAALHVSPVAAATGTLTAERITGAANTNQTLSTEIPDIDWALARTVQWATGALTTQRAVKIAAPTNSFVGASTITNAATLGITGAPVGGTNATTTNTSALLISAGAVNGATTPLNSYGLSVNAQTGASSTNYAAQFIGGSVGIGTSQPVSLLANTSTGIVGSDSNSTNTSALSWVQNNGGYAGAFYNADTAAQSNGLAVKVANNGSTTNAFDVSYGTAQATAGTSLFVVKGTGNVGIGTTSPTRILEITGAPVVNGVAREVLSVNDTTAYAAGVGGGIAFGGKYNAAGAIAGELASIQGIKENATDGNYAGALMFNTRINGGSPTERVRIDSTGNVGIGTANPDNQLQATSNISTIDGAGYLTNIYFSGGWKYSANGYGTAMYGASGKNYFSVFANNAAGGHAAAATEIKAITIDQSNGNVGIGTTTAGYILTVNGQPGANGYTAFTNYSDRRLKEDIRYLDAGSLEKVLQLKPAHFRYNDKYFAVTGYDKKTQKRLLTGFIAQDLQKVFPDMVTDKKIGKESYFDTNLSYLQIYLVKAIQELYAKFTVLVSEVGSQKSEVQELKADNDNLKADDRKQFAALKAANDNEAAQIKALTARLDALEAAHH